METPEESAKKSSKVRLDGGESQTEKVSE